MTEKLRLNEKNAIIYLFLGIIFSSVSLYVFYQNFVVYNPVVYMAGVVLLIVSFSCLIYILLKTRKKDAPVKKAVISGGVIGIFIFLGMTIIHSVILKNEFPYEVAGYMTAMLCTVIYILAIITALGIKTQRLFRVLTVPLCVVFLLPTGLLSVKNMLPVTYDFPFEDKTEITKGLDSVSDSKRLIVNADDSHWWGFWDELAQECRTDEESLNAYVMQYASTGVTDLIFNIFCQSSDVPSDIMTFRGDLYGQTTQNGKSVDYSCYYGLNEFYNNKNIDIFGVWIEKCKAEGINAWLSLRMNDCHDPDKETSALRGELFYEAVEKGWTIGDEYGYYRNCLNYKIPEVRQLMLDFTEEQLMKYDVYGFELDFMREIYCFDYKNESNSEIVAVMNDYMRSTAKIVEAAEKKWEHEIKLSVRLMRDLDQCKAYGFDVLTWCSEGLVDSITVTPRFTSNDSDMPISDWIKRCPDIEIYAGIETLINTNKNSCHADAEAVRGYGAQYLTQGADGIYLFNYMSAGTVNSRNGEVYETCGELSEILKHSRRHIVTYQDTVPDGYEPYSPLPLKIKSGKTEELKISTGYIPENAKISVYIGLKKEQDNAISLEIDGRACEYNGRSQIFGESEKDFSDVPQGYCSEDCIIYEYTLDDCSELPNTLTLKLTNSQKTATVTYAEIKIHIT